MREKKELIWPFLIGFLAFLFSFWPTVWAYLQTPEGFFFTGFNFLHDPWDINTYFANIRQGLNGHWAYRNPYDSSLGEVLPVYSLYIFLGHLARIFNLSAPAIYHFSSLALTLLFSLTLYFFLGFFLKEKSWRLFTLSLILFGGGLGWLGFNKKIYLADISFPDATVFQTLHLPHFLLNQTLLVLTLLFSLWAILKKKWSLSITASLLGLSLAFVHPYSLGVTILILAGYFLILSLAKKPLSGLVYLFPPIIFWAAILLFFYFLLKATPFYSQEITSPSPWYFFLSYGVLSPLAILGAIYFWRSKDEKNLFLLAWLIFQFLALYLPFSFQRLLIKGFFIILCLAAVWGLKSLKMFQKLKNPWPVSLWLLFFSSFTQVLATFLLILPGFFTEDWLYRAKEEKLAFDFLLKEARENESVLASYQTSNFLPAYTNSRAYYGHGWLVADGKEREKKVSSFFSGRLGKDFLSQEKISYVFWGPQEKTLGDFDLTRVSYLEKIYQNEKVTVFKVK